jgi:5,10-methylene-tetrahydrofolate dehydrogenase/methenyl tetrahydrofolate cyclohydrolase
MKSVAQRLIVAPIILAFLGAIVGVMQHVRTSRPPSVASYSLFSADDIDLRYGTGVWATTAVVGEEDGLEEMRLTKRIDGKGMAQEITAELKAEIEEMGGPAPRLVVVEVGDNPASGAYIRNKQRAAEHCGIDSSVIKLPNTATQEELLTTVSELNNDLTVNGIIVQLPLPSHIDATVVTESVADAKDVDGLCCSNIGKVALRGQRPHLVACTPLGCLEILKRIGAPLRGKEAVVVGASNTVGIPMMLLLLQQGCTVTVCRSDTKDTASHTRNADILVVAVGVAHLVKEHWVKPGAIVIDVGINAIPDSTKKSGRRLVGDVDFEKVLPIASRITPVPGGVGPMTVAMLMKNTVQATRAQRGHLE